MVQPAFRTCKGKPVVGWLFDALVSDIRYEEVVILNCRRTNHRGRPVPLDVAPLDRIHIVRAILCIISLR